MNWLPRVLPSPLLSATSVALRPSGEVVREIGWRPTECVFNAWVRSLRAQVKADDRAVGLAEEEAGVAGRGVGREDLPLA